MKLLAGRGFRCGDTKAPPVFPRTTLFFVCQYQTNYQKKEMELADEKSSQVVLDVEKEENLKKEEPKRKKALTPPEASCGARTRLCCYVFWTTNCGKFFLFWIVCGLMFAVATVWIALNAFLVRIHLLGYLWSNEDSAWAEVGLPHVFAQMVFLCMILLVAMVSSKCISVYQEVQLKMRNPNIQVV